MPGKNYEFIEFKNTGGTIIDLSFAKIGGGINYAFPFYSRLQSNAYLVLASNSEAFETRYGFVPDGEYTKHLNSQGETISIADLESDTLLSFTYQTDPPWPVVTDGKGYTIVSALTNPTGNPSEPESDVG